MNCGQWTSVLLIVLEDQFTSSCSWATKSLKIFKDFTFCKMSVMCDHVMSINSVIATVHEDTIRWRMVYLLNTDVSFKFMSVFHYFFLFLWQIKYQLLSMFAYTLKYRYLSLSSRHDKSLTTRLQWAYRAKLQSLRLLIVLSVVFSRHCSVLSCVLYSSDGSVSRRDVTSMVVTHGACQPWCPVDCCTQSALIG